MADHELDVALEARSSGEAVVVAVLAFGVAGLLAGVEGAVIVRVFGGGGGGAESIAIVAEAGERARAVPEAPTVTDASAQATTQR